VGGTQASGSFKAPMVIQHATKMGNRWIRWYHGQQPGDRDILYAILGQQNGWHCVCLGPEATANNVTVLFLCCQVEGTTLVPSRREVAGV